jgi:FKBP-type peptidyl-prolyl cis-trans isomerase (trigger factor)
MGDRVTIDTDGYDKNGNIMETTSMRAYPLVLGSALLVPGFEE